MIQVYHNASRGQRGGYGGRVPRQADHEQRRRQIADALVRIAATRGLHNAGMREVAAEAGVSVRLIQYYFGTKEELLRFTMEYLARQFAERAKARFRPAGAASPAGPRAIIDAILTEALPTDEDSRVFHIVYSSYTSLSLTDPVYAMETPMHASDAVENVIAAQLAKAQQAGQAPADFDARVEATSLMAMSAALSISVLAGQRSAENALEILHYHLDRMLPPDRSPAGTASLPGSSPSWQATPHQ
jgi:AcrR family transcriptional regulator